MPVHGVGVEGAELGVFGDGRALEGVAVQVVPGVAGDAGGVGDGPHGHLGRHVRVDVLAELGVEVRPLEEGVAGARVLVVVLGAGLPPPAGALAQQHEEEGEEEDAHHEDGDAHHLLQADVPGGGDQVGVHLRTQLAAPPAEAQGAVAEEGAVGVLAQAAVGARVLHALVYVTQAPG